MEAFKAASAAYLDRGEGIRIASMIALGALKFLNADERKSLRRELEVMDILLDESILDLADEALKARYETALKNKAKMGIDLRHGYLNCSYCLVNDYILVYRFSSNVSFFC